MEKQIIAGIGNKSFNIRVKAVGNVPEAMGNHDILLSVTASTFNLRVKCRNFLTTMKILVFWTHNIL
jgi:hypothetical protein